MTMGISCKGTFATKVLLTLVGALLFSNKVYFLSEVRRAGRERGEFNSSGLVKTKTLCCEFRDLHDPHTYIDTPTREREREKPRLSKMQ